MRQELEKNLILVSLFLNVLYIKITQNYLTVRTHYLSKFQILLNYLEKFWQISILISSLSTGTISI